MKTQNYLICEVLLAVLLEVCLLRYYDTVYLGEGFPQSFNGSSCLLGQGAPKDKDITTPNLLKPTGHVMHQQFNIQQLYVLPTLYLCVLYLSENKQRLVPLTA